MSGWGWVFPWGGGAGSGSGRRGPCGAGWVLCGDWWGVDLLGGVVGQVCGCLGLVGVGVGWVEVGCPGGTVRIWGGAGCSRGLMFIPLSISCFTSLATRPLILSATIVLAFFSSNICVSRSSFCTVTTLLTLLFSFLNQPPLSSSTSSPTSFPLAASLSSGSFL